MMAMNKKSILIIDDDEEDHIIIRDALLETGVNATIYYSFSGQMGLELLNELKDDLPSLILLDLNMPMMDGMETLKRIKEKYSTPVLMHTTACSASLRHEVKSKGALDCIKKGISHSEIIKTAELVKEVIENTLVFEKLP
jgi:CheY-like chemotaxis protein